jgi:uncharacterized protein YprB with RNaseH-like and TPR domain
MIENSFVILDRVGYKTEEKLWNQGILSWDDFLNSNQVTGLSKKQKNNHEIELEFAKESLENRDHKYFSQRFKSRDYWRLYSDFSSECCFLDIETTGLGPENEITVVGIFNGQTTKSFVRGINLSKETIEKELSKYRLVLTFYGSGFDIPFIKREFPGICLDQAHIDLYFASKRTGLRGGLKKIERDLGISRNELIDEIDGFEAVRLWRRWERSKNKEALEKLVEYNKADVVNLKELAEVVYQKLRAKTFPSSNSS